MGSEAADLTSARYMDALAEKVLQDYEVYILYMFVKGINIAPYNSSFLQKIVRILKQNKFAFA